MDNCIFCQVVAGSIPSTPVYQDESFIVIPDIHPQASVHLLVIPKKHVGDLMEADDALASTLMLLVKKIIREQHIKDFRLVHNGGGAAFINHLHMHIMGQIDKNRTL